jgi:hypothetical protein
MTKVAELMDAFEKGQAAKRKHLQGDCVLPEGYAGGPLAAAFLVGYHLVQPEEAVAVHIQVNGLDDGNFQWLMIDKTTGKGTTANMSPEQFLRVMEYLELCKQSYLQAR